MRGSYAGQQQMSQGREYKLYFANGFLQTSGSYNNQEQVVY